MTLEQTLPPPTTEPVILDAPAPAHVPRHLIRDVRVALGYAANHGIEPYDVTRRLQQDDVPPVMWSPFPNAMAPEGSWVLRNYKDIQLIYTDESLSSTKGLAAFQALAGETWPSIPMGIDAPDHARYRRFLNPSFTARAVAAMEKDIRALCDQMIDPFIEQGGGDFAWDFARVFPVRVFLNLMGLPFSMFEQFLAWEYEILHTRDNARIAEAARGIVAYLRAFIEEKLGAKDDTLTSRIVNGEIEGRPLTDDERIGIIFFLWLGGLDTVASTLSLMFRRLALDSGLQQRLRDNPSLIRGAVEEFLRTQPLVNSTRRLKRDLVLHGVEMKAGDAVTCLTTVGAFDPAAFDAPRSFDPERKANRHFTFSSGPHLCLGAHLARQELVIALEHWLSRVPPFRLAEGDDLRVVPGLMAVRNLPLVW